MFGFLGKIFGGGVFDSVLGMVGDYFKEKRKLKLMEASLKQTVVLEQQKRITTQQTADINWDLTQIEASKGSWKDELWTVVFAIVFMMNFIPYFNPWVKQGWETLGSIDTFWKSVFATAIGAAFSTRELTKFFRKK